MGCLGGKEHLGDGKCILVLDVAGVHILLGVGAVRNMRRETVRAKRRQTQKFKEGFIFFYFTDTVLHAILVDNEPKRDTPMVLNTMLYGHTF